jgi:hypothetical protein
MKMMKKTHTNSPPVSKTLETMSFKPVSLMLLLMLMLLLPPPRRRRCTLVPLP